MSFRYVKPELIDLTGMESFGLCEGNGSGDTSRCIGNGNAAGRTGGSFGCGDFGNTAITLCDDGNVATIED